MGDLISAPASYRRLAGLAEDASFPANLLDAFAELRGRSPERMQEVAADFAGVIGCLQRLLDPEVFVLQAPICQLGDEFALAILRQVDRQEPALQGMPPRVELSLLREEAGALGAASLALQNRQPQ